MPELQINTTQNVKINYTAAGAGERLVAYFIDACIKWGYLIILSSIFGVFDDLDEWSQIGVSTLLSLPVIFYTLLLELFLDGQTLGKKAMKIRVVKIDGYQASLADYLIRWFFRIVDIYIFGMGLFFIAFSKKSQRIGDMAAGTAVISIKDRVLMSHTILENLKEGYKPTYPTVIKLSDNDARIIKETYTVAKSSKDYRTLIKLRNKIVEVAEIKDRKHKDDIEFIGVILKDYNYYTQNM